MNPVHHVGYVRKCPERTAAVGAVQYVRGYKRGDLPLRLVSLRLLVLALCAVFGWCSVCRAEDAPLQLKIGYVWTKPSRIKISLLDIPADNDGLAGAQLAIDDNNTTGQFLNQSFSIVDRQLADGEDVAEVANALAAQGVGMIVASLDAERLLALADAARKHGQIVLNAAATDERLREQDCRGNVVHVAPSRTMLADGLAQYLVWKKWSKWLLVVGSHDNDKLFADALRESATKFGAKIVGEREFKDTGGARRTDSGVVDIQRQMPVLTQGAPDHDVLVAADESEVFAGYLPYRTWLPRPVAGSAGLVPGTWNAGFDQWGAIQLQNRFTVKFRRTMTALDMQAWTAVRMVGEASAHAGSADTARLFDYIKGPDFSVAAFKGQKLTLRDWDLQLRQPIVLFDGRNTVSVSPQEGYLHQYSTLDTLGTDRPTTKCKLN
jgi:ABC transporter substrate binding protein (PQQ-dependent alcohol dehydrogenase system)